MSVNLTKSPVWIVAVIVGLIVATALVAGYVDRPGTATQVAAADGKCADCPLAGTDECCKVTGQCAAGTCDADAAGAAVMALQADSTASTCAATAGTCSQKTAATCPASAAGAAVMAQTDDSAGATCPMKAAAASGCAGGQCPATQ